MTDQQMDLVAELDAIAKDDTPQYMAKQMPVIGPPDPKDPHLVLTIETLQEA